VLALRASEPKEQVHNSRNAEKGESEGAPLTIAGQQKKPPFALQAMMGEKGNTDQKLKPPSVLRMQLVGANLNPQISGIDALPSKANYFRGNDPKQWRTNIPAYAKVKYENVYLGIDLIYYGSHRQLEYDFVVAPGADLKTIRLAFAGADKLNIEAQGDLVLIPQAVRCAYTSPSSIRR